MVLLVVQMKKLTILIAKEILADTSSGKRVLLFLIVK